MESDLSERYNDGLVPPPDLAGEPARLQRPSWQPTPAQVEAARRLLARNLIILTLLLCGLALALGWRP